MLAEDPATAKVEQHEVQAVLDNSVQVKETSSRDVEVDRGSGRNVVFKETAENVFHGHATTGLK